MFTLVVFCLFFFSACQDLPLCYAEHLKLINGEGMTIKLQGELMQTFNEYRNEVALGNISNWENKGMTASLMNYITWDNKLATIASECVNLCGENFQYCNLPIEYGKLWYTSQTLLLHALNFNARSLLKTWTKEIYLQKQVQQGDLTHFGCAIVQMEVPNLRFKFHDFILCLLDKNQNIKEFDKKAVYQGGPTGSQCPNGLMSPYEGLCKQ